MLRNALLPPGPGAARRAAALVCDQSTARARRGSRRWHRGFGQRPMCYVSGRRSGRIIMSDRNLTAAAAVALTVALTMPVGGVQAADNAEYPNWKGQWIPVVAPGLGGQAIKFDPAKPEGPGQQAPLTPEYQKILEDSMADQANGGHRT